MKTLLLSALSFGMALTLAPQVNAKTLEEGNWLVRGRIIDLMPANNGGHSATGGKPFVGNDVMPEVDITYFATENIAFELIASTTRHNAKVAQTAVDLGAVRLLPPTLTAQYHFTDLGKWKPYLGAGITYAYFYDSDHPGYGSVKYDSTFGFAMQAGVDYKLKEKWYLNADVKKILLSTDVTVNDTIKAKAQLNPWVFGFGVGYRF